MSFPAALLAVPARNMYDLCSIFKVQNARCARYEGEWRCLRRRVRGLDRLRAAFDLDVLDRLGAALDLWMVLMGSGLRTLQ